MTTLKERLLGKVLDSIAKEGDVSAIRFSDQSGFAVNTAISAHLVAESGVAEVTSFEEHDDFYRISLAGSSHIDISKEISSPSPEIFVFVDVDGQYVVE